MRGCWRLAVSVFIAVLLACCGTTESGNVTPAGGGTVGKEGGTVCVDDPASPAFGAAVDALPGTFEQETAVSVEVLGGYDPKLPAGFELKGPALKFRTAGGAAPAKAVFLTVPYEAGAVEDPSDLLVVFQHPESGRLRPLSVKWIDHEAHTATALASQLAAPEDGEAGKEDDAATPWYVTLIIGPTGERARADWHFFDELVDGVPVGALTYDPAKHGFHIPNRGSYLTPGGSCNGMSAFSIFLFTDEPSMSLYSDDLFNDQDTEERDDATAWKTGAVAHYRSYHLYEKPLWNAGEKDIFWWHVQHPENVAKHMVWLLELTGEPLLITLGANAEVDRPAPRTKVVPKHAIVAYQVVRGIDKKAREALFFRCYDPNHPGKTMEILYTEDGFDAYQQKYIAVSYETLFGMAGVVQYGKILAAAQDGKLGSEEGERFPKIKIVSPKVLSTPAMGDTPGFEYATTDQASLAIEGEISAAEMLTIYGDPIGDATLWLEVDGKKAQGMPLVVSGWQDKATFSGVVDLADGAGTIAIFVNSEKPSEESPSSTARWAAWREFTIVKDWCGGKERIWLDDATGLQWQDPPKEAGKCIGGSQYDHGLSWQEAKDYCDGLEWAGHSDWRLPTIGELRTLLRGCPDTEPGGACGVTDDCLTAIPPECEDPPESDKPECNQFCLKKNDACQGCNPESWPGDWFLDEKLYVCQQLHGGGHWSTSEVTNVPERAWGIDPGNAEVAARKKTSCGGASARCVR
ncbi:MAG: DUF1566 domain-containing protein [Deltaproteobacteria bacterium]|nr:DUF1566 domain-containing protein [Deltaproteobacteria bacterium]